MDKSINDFAWYKDREAIFVANKILADRIFHVNFKDPFNPLFTEISQDNKTSYSTLISVVYNSKENYLVSTKVAHYLPEHVVKMDILVDEQGIKTGEEKIVLAFFH